MPRWFVKRICASVGMLALLFGLVGGGATMCAQEASREEISLYREAAELQNQNRFELAATVWKDFVSKYPESQYALKAQYYEGICQLQSRNLKEAATAFDKVIQKQADTPDTSLVEDAYLNLAWTNLTLAQQGDANAAALFTKSRETAAALIKKFPESKHADKALFYQAEALYLTGKKEQALVPYQRLVRDFPESSLRLNTLYALGVALEQLDKYEAAGVIYDLFLQEFPDDKLAAEVQTRKAETILQEGLARKQEGDTDGARDAFEQSEQLFVAVNSLPNFQSIDHVLSRRAVIAAELGDLIQAATLYAKIADEFPESVYADEATISAGRLFYREKKFEQASLWFQQVLSGKSDFREEAAHWQCLIFLKAGEPKEALELATRVLGTVDKGEYRVALLMDQADAAYEVPDAKLQSEQMYLNLAQKHPDDSLAPRALYNAAFAAQQRSDGDNALRLAKNFLEKYPDDFFAPDVLSIQAETLLKKEQVAEAATIWKQLIDQHAGHRDADLWTLRLGLSHYLQQQYAESISTLSPLASQIKTPSRLAETTYLVGASYRSQGDFAKAIPWLQRSISADSQWKQVNEVRLALAECQLKQGEADSALAMLDDVIEQSTDRLQQNRAHYLKAESFYASRQYDEAIAEYSFVTDAPEQSEFKQHANYGLGWSHLRIQDFSSAIEAFDRIIMESPDHPLVADAVLGRGLARRQVGEYAKAIGDFERFLVDDPDADQNENARYEKAQCELELMTYKEAISSLTGLLEDYAQSEKKMQYMYDLAWAYKYSGDEGESKDLFESIANDYADEKYASEAHFHVGEFAYNAKRYSDAVDRYRKALAVDRDEPLAEKLNYKLGWSLFHLEKFSDSEKTFRQQVSDFPTGDLAVDGQFMIAESLFRDSKYAAALPEFELTLKRIATGATADENVRTLCALHGAQSANQLKKFDTAEKFLSSDFDRLADSAYEAEAWYELAAAHQGLKENELATNAYEKAATLSQGKVGARARSMVGEIAFLEKRYDDAINQYQRVMYGFGAEDAPAEVKKWQAFAGYEAARCNHVQISTQDDSQAKSRLIEKAIEFYSYVVQQHPQDPLAVDAKTQLSRLQRLK